MASSVKPVMVHAKQPKSARDRCQELPYTRKCSRQFPFRGAHRTWLLEHVVKQRWQCRRQSIRIQRKLLRQRTKTNACRHMRNLRRYSFAKLPTAGNGAHLKCVALQRWHQSAYNAHGQLRSRGQITTPARTGLHTSSYNPSVRISVRGNRNPPKGNVLFAPGTP